MRFTQADYDAYLARRRVENRNVLVADQTPADPTPAGQEWKLHQQIEEECQRRGWFAIHSRMDQRTTVGCGVPDWIIFAQGKTYVVECKTAQGKLSMAQQGVFVHLEKLGHKPVVVRSLAEFLQAVGS